LPGGLRLGGGVYTAAAGYFETQVKNLHGSFILTQKDQTSDLASQYIPALLAHFDAASALEESRHP
jgi:hypothetical protein